MVSDADEALLEIGVDHARRLRRPGPSFDRPGARFLRADGEESDEMQEVVASPDDAVEARLGQPDGFEIVLLLGLRQHGDLALDLCRDDDRDRALFRSLLLDQIGEGVALVGGRLVDVADVEHGLRRQEPERLKEVVLLAADASRPRGPAFAQLRETALGERQQVLGVLVAALGLLLHRYDAPFETLEIGQHQFGLDRVDVGQGVDPSLDMGDVAVLEAANDMGDRVAFPDVGEKLVTEAFALRGAADKTRDVDEGETCGNDLLRAGDLRQREQSRVGNGDVADIGLDRAERIIGRLGGSRLRQRVEERRFADIGQTHDAAFEAHGARPVDAGTWKDGALCAGAAKRQGGGPELSAPP